MKKTKPTFERILEELFYAWKDIRNHPHQQTKGVDGESISMFSKDARKKIIKLREELRLKKFHFDKLRPHTISQKGKPREILICTVRDRVVSRAILRIIRPPFNKQISPYDYANRRKKKKDKLGGIPLAALTIQQKIRDGYIWVFETDIKSFFDTVNKKAVLSMINGQISDPYLKTLISELINFQVEKEQKEEILLGGSGYSEDSGIAQGSAISPFVASLYLSEFDRQLTTGIDCHLVRYVDDLVVLCRDEATANIIYKKVADELRKLGLEIHEINKPTKTGRVKTRIIKATQGSFVFLGLKFNAADIDICEEKKSEFVSKLRDLTFSGGNFWTTMSSFNHKIDGFAKQYIYPDLYNSKQSLESIVSDAEDALYAFYVTSTEKILGVLPHALRTTSTTDMGRQKQIEKYKKFLGINFKPLIEVPDLEKKRRLAVKEITESWKKATPRKAVRKS